MTHTAFLCLHSNGALDLEIDLLMIKIFKVLCRTVLFIHPVWQTEASLHVFVPWSVAVKEKEDLHPDVESQGMNDDTFCEYR